MRTRGEWRTVEPACRTERRRESLGESEDDDEGRRRRACTSLFCTRPMHACMHEAQRLTHSKAHCSKALPKRIQSASIQTTSNRRPAGLPTLASSSCPNKCKCKMQNAKCKVANGFMAVHASTVYATTSATTGKRLQQMNSFVRRKACASKRASKPILLCTICMAWHAWAFTFTSL